MNEQDFPNVQILYGTNWYVERLYQMGYYYIIPYHTLEGIIGLRIRG